MDEKRIKEVLSDKEYVESLLNMHSCEEVQKSLAEKDIDVSVEDLRKVGKVLIKKAKGELTDEDLKEVAGGFLVETFVISILCTAGLGFTFSAPLIACGIGECG